MIRALTASPAAAAALAAPCARARPTTLQLARRLLRVGAFGLVLSCVADPGAKPALAQAQLTAVPADFSIRIVSSALGTTETPPDIEWVEIKASGDALFSAMPSQRGWLPAGSVKIRPDAVARIYKAVLDQRFFELQSLYSNPSIDDGDEADTTVTAGGRTYSVRTVNITVFAFDRVTLAVDRELPIERRIQYNALREPSYNKVER
jgi:hypothetical protein